MSNPYRRTIPRDENGTSDIYDVLHAFNVANPAVQHALKKLLCPGQRGAKGVLQDLEEARKSIVRAIELERQKLVAPTQRSASKIPEPPCTCGCLSCAKCYPEAT